MNFDIATKGGKRYTYLAKIKINLDIKNYDAQLLENDRLDQLYEIIHNFLGQNQREIINSLKPALEEAISKQIILLSNGIVTHFPYEELFPDRT